MPALVAGLNMVAATFLWYSNGFFSARICFFAPDYGCAAATLLPACMVTASRGIYSPTLYAALTYLVAPRHAPHYLALPQGAATHRRAASRCARWRSRSPYFQPVALPPRSHHAAATVIALCAGGCRANGGSPVLRRQGSWAGRVTLYRLRKNVAYTSRVGRGLGRWVYGWCYALRTDRRGRLPTAVRSPAFYGPHQNRRAPHLTLTTLPATHTDVHLPLSAQPLHLFPFAARACRDRHRCAGRGMREPWTGGRFLSLH